MNEDIMFYCVKDRMKKHGKPGTIQEVTMKNGKKAKKAVCESCGTMMFRIG